MRARYAGECPSCETEIEPGQEVGKFLGRWLHIDCRGAELAERKRNFGPPVEVPQEIFGNETITYVGTRRLRRQGLESLRSRTLP